MVGGVLVGGVLVGGVMVVTRAGRERARRVATYQSRGMDSGTRRFGARRIVLAHTID